jgi:hypothetical protein
MRCPEDGGATLIQNIFVIICAFALGENKLTFMNYAIPRYMFPVLLLVLDFGKVKKKVKLSL